LRIGKLSLTQYFARFGLNELSSRKAGVSDVGDPTGVAILQERDGKWGYPPAWPL
jgi:hypothetical protein